ncbi:ABC transporter ATP-binding protein [Stomatobaculum longum]|uniref:ABC transporter ATP-binding protein n=1 Tax=Stomatobaculum longum TaxID=796942 RepID=UPI0028E5082F|nr:ABC transporter ATP-binding protein [Stomatobaculum longum]
MKVLLPILKKYRREAVLAPLFKLVEALLELIVPLIMARIIDRGIAMGDRGYVLQQSALLLLLGAAGLGFSITAQYFAAKAAMRLGGELRHRLFTKVQELSFSQLDLFGADTLITRMTSDVNQVQSGVNMVLRLFLRSPFIVFGAMIMAFTIDVPSALIFAVAIPVIGAVVFWILLTTLPLYKKVQGRLDQIMTSTRENLTGVRVIRAFRQEENEKQHYAERNAALFAEQIRVGRISGLMNPLTYVLINLAIVALIQTDAVRVNAGILATGQVVALLNYMSQILVELIKLANLIIQVTRAMACSDRVAAVLEVQCDMQDGNEDTAKVFAGEAADADGRKKAVEFRDVSLRYDAESGEALSHISFTAYAGDTIGIIGGTGSGKSSLVNLIPRFYDVTAGEVAVFGEDVRKLTLESLRAAVGMVLQKAELFQGSIADNLRWGKEDADNAAFWEALTVAQAKEYVETKPGQLDFRLEQNARNLSGGQKQRLTIARALMKKPEILILDDSASALDFATDAALRTAIRESAKDITCFIVSQRAASVQYADRILVLDNGRLVGSGTHDELLRDNRVYQEIYYSQFPKEA